MACKRVSWRFVILIVVATFLTAFYIGSSTSTVSRGENNLHPHSAMEIEAHLKRIEVMHEAQLKRMQVQAQQFPTDIHLKAIEGMMEVSRTQQSTTETSLKRIEGILTKEASQPPPASGGETTVEDLTSVCEELASNGYPQACDAHCKAPGAIAKSIDDVPAKPIVFPSGVNQTSIYVGVVPNFDTVKGYVIVNTKSQYSLDGFKGKPKLLTKCDEYKDGCVLLVAEMKTSYGVSQPEPGTIVVQLPLQELLVIIPAHIEAKECIFDGSDSDAILSCGGAVRKCTTIVSEGGSFAASALTFLKGQNFQCSANSCKRGGVVDKTFTKTEFAIKASLLNTGSATEAGLDIGIAGEFLYGENPKDFFNIPIEASHKEIHRNALLAECRTFNNCHMFMAAISTGTGILQFLQTERHGGNSLDTPADVWPMDFKSCLVPVLPLKILLDAIPKSVEFKTSKTDTNGNDHRVLRSAGDAITRVSNWEVEFIIDGTAGPRCQFENAWEFMTKHKYNTVVHGGNELYIDTAFSRGDRDQ